MSNSPSPSTSASSASTTSLDYLGMVSGLTGLPFDPNTVINGLLAADHIFELDADVLGLAADLEGHPDNVAPCTLGSIVASAIDSGGVTRAVRLEMPQHFGLAAFHAPVPGRTQRRARPLHWVLEAVCHQPRRARCGHRDSGRSAQCGARPA